MPEVLRYLRANGDQTCIVTGGGQDFVRAYAEQVYGIPPEQVGMKNDWTRVLAFDEGELRYFNGLPTSFELEAEAVDRLRGAARRLLRQSPEFQALREKLGGRTNSR
jgi:hypothetical protein